MRFIWSVFQSISKYKLIRLVSGWSAVDHVRMAERIGKKRNRGTDDDAPSLSTEALEVQTLFQQYQRELDYNHDKRERLVKLGRDVTIQSKRIIFLLHRALSAADITTILSEADNKLQDVSKLLCKVAEELVNEDPTRYRTAYTIGVQEYIEALSFYHYWKEGTVLSYPAAQGYMTFHDDKVLLLSPFDYLLGLTDLTGELMRVAVSSVGTGSWDTPQLVVKFVRQLYVGLITLNHFSINKEFLKKLEMTLTNLLKIEQACYALTIRSSGIIRDTSN